MFKRILLAVSMAIFLAGCTKASLPNQAIPTPPSGVPAVTTAVVLASPAGKDLTQQFKESAHYKFNVSCQMCHKIGGSQMFTLNNPGWEACGICHSSTITLGQEVTNPQFTMIKGIGVGEVPDMPTIKYQLGDKFACYDCHVTDATHHEFTVPGSIIMTGTQAADSKFDLQQFGTLLHSDKCILCHFEPETTLNKLSQHRTDVEGMLKLLKSIYDEWAPKIARLDPADPRVKAFQDGSTYYTYVVADGSKGVHNFELTKALLNQALIKFSALK